ncbi:MAG TPA: DUF2306 domain-containing protein [Mycobacteriales bacterium]|nr:DUF2306 domain-containing protein [Mycobacteriales bacterium]
MSERWTVLIALHAAGATLAAVLGGYLVLRPRKGDLLHRRIGRVWMVDMYWVALSSFGIKQLTRGHFSWIHGLSLWTLFTLTMAIVAARRHDVRQHRAWVVGTYLGLLGAGVAAVAFPTRLVPQTAIHYPLWLLLALLTITLLAAVVVRAASLPPRVVRARADNRRVHVLTSLTGRYRRARVLGRQQL